MPVAVIALRWVGAFSLTAWAFISLVVSASAGGSEPLNLGALACHGSLLGHPLNEPIEGISPTPDREGYWLVASDGGVFAFGDAGFFGSMGGRPINRPVIGMAPTVDGGGYWLVASDGGVFAFGDAGFFGSTGGRPLNQPVIGMAPTSDGFGYWLAAADGGIFSFGDAPFFGSGPQVDPGVVNFVAFAATTDSRGYILGNASRSIELLAFGDARYAGVGFAPTDTSPLVGLTQPMASDNYAYWDVTAAGGVDFNEPGPAIGLGSQTSC
jgi:hypothetical protein